MYINTDLKQLYERKKQIENRLNTEIERHKKEKQLIEIMLQLNQDEINLVYSYQGLKLMDENSL